MKVAQILYSGVGGHGSVAFSLIDADRNSEWQSSMAFLGVESLSGSYVKQCTEKHIDYEYIAATKGKPWKSWQKLFEWLSFKEPDAIVLHSTNAILPCWFYTKIKNIPLITVEHTPNVIKRKSEWIASWLAMRLTDTMILLTVEYEKELRKHLGWFYLENKIHIIPNGINTDYFVSAGSILLATSNVIRLGMAARFSSKKRQDILIEMMVLLKEQAKGVKYHLSLAGDGETWDVLHKKVKELGLEESISFTGYLGEEDLLKWFQSIDIYLHGSEGETLSTSLLQALSMGLPTIGSNVKGIANLLLEGDGCGILVDNTAKGFSDAVVGLTDNPLQANILSAKARELAVSKYSQDTMFDLYNKTIKELKT